jgi:hypothetical protein
MEGLGERFQKKKGHYGKDEETDKGGEEKRFFKRIDQVSLNAEKENEEGDEREHQFPLKPEVHSFSSWNRYPTPRMVSMAFPKGPTFSLKRRIWVSTVRAYPS